MRKTIINCDVCKRTITTTKKYDGVTQYDRFAYMWVCLLSKLDLDLCDVCVHAIIEALYPRLNSVVSLRNPTLLSNS